MNEQGSIFFLMAIWSLLINYEWTNGMLSQKSFGYLVCNRSINDAKTSFNVASFSLSARLPSTRTELKFLRDDFYLHAILHNELFIAERRKCSLSLFPYFSSSLKCLRTNFLCNGNLYRLNPLNVKYKSWGDSKISFAVARAFKRADIQ